MTKPSTPYTDMLSEELADPERAAGYLSAAFEEYTRDSSEDAWEIILIAVQDVAQAREKADLDFSRSSAREEIDRVFSSHERYEVPALERVFDLLGIEFKGMRLKPKHAPAEVKRHLPTPPETRDEKGKDHERKRH